MSRVGKKPLPIPEKTNVTFQNGLIQVKGEKGSLSRDIHPDMDVRIEDNTVFVVPNEQGKESKALSGLTRSLINNMVIGVSKGFERILEINGIGYRAEKSGEELILNIGFSNPVRFRIPEGITATVEKNNVIKLSSIDKEKLGHAAAAIRRLRPPEPYKGKGIKYAEERIQKKAGKTGTK